MCRSCYKEGLQIERTEQWKQCKLLFDLHRREDEKWGENQINKEEKNLWKWQRRHVKVLKGDQLLHL